MKLTSKQQDSILELINIAFSRAAASLSSLTGERVELDVPRISLHPVNELPAVFGELMQGEVSTVHQIFSGNISGNAMMILDCEGARILSALMTNEETQPVEAPLTETNREVLTEVGNVLLNACLGTFGNILQVHISFSVPHLQVDMLGSMMHSIQIGAEELKFALVVVTNFRLRGSAVGGYLLMVLGVSSLDRLIEAIENLG